MKIVSYNSIPKGVNLLCKYLLQSRLEKVDDCLIIIRMIYAGQRDHHQNDVCGKKRIPVGPSLR